MDVYPRQPEGGKDRYPENKDEENKQERKERSWRSRYDLFFSHL